ncbi:DEHA2D13420p [Debaryomyces hansenii CBS767]|uniref:DEHA2D13420p n=1 Tax=Debaryomyces hansenii (strain ATCC 36239 / CBS 767 / BCRC 21394 / JCM 1990 / NBRC 0083 / IGC 2968) TaxID=284592 RepID=Q6BRW2_DEBHA|nr:DEHA2D13420p [Debaryomyces hansenii CBS767]CAG87226.2 DEHA2D13420p [Debaryomyces hansenii CBS767]|eukprot:XP_459058.2 DEHA2D13420p [Debaryomyces hansenii CBS767]
MGKKSKSKVPQQKLDLSEEIISNESRKVADYDYDLLQSGNPDKQFENDLDYLLESVDNQPMRRSDAKESFIPDEIANYEEAISNDGPVSKGRRAKKFKITLTDITKDINDINFSSDSEHEKPIETSKTKKEKTKTKTKTKPDLDIGKLERRIVADNPDEIENHSSESEEIKQRRKEKRQRKDQRRKLRKANQQESNNDSTTEQPEPSKNINEKITSNEPSDQEMKKKSKKDKKKKKEKSNTNTKIFKEDIKHEELENNNGPDSVELTEEEIAEALKKEENEIDSALNESLKKSKRKDRKKKKQARDENPNKEQSPDSTILVSKTDELVTLDELKSQKVVDQEYSIYDEEANLTRKERDRLHRERSSETSYKESKDKHSPFDVTLRSTMKTNTNKKYSDSLPAVQCIKTIIGLSHQQILSLSLSDVKIKTIVSSSSISKFAHHVLKFVIKYSHDLFSDDQKKLTFFKLCMNVALYESSGFRKTVQSCPYVLEWFGHYDELTLEQTHTRLTPSSRNIHQNNFDYSVLAYIGHVLIWAAYQQRSNHMPTFFNKYNIELSVNEIERSIGGFHLWDRLRKMHDTMNSKRWKHVVKFRQAFAYEEDQFMLILRFMDVDSTIP